MTFTELTQKLARQLEDYRRVPAFVDGAALCQELLADLESVQATLADQLLTLREAAKLTGLTAAHLGHLVREGRIPNAGRVGAPRIRRKDLPNSFGPLTSDDKPASLSPRQIARLVVRR